MRKRRKLAEEARNFDESEDLNHLLPEISNTIREMIDEGKLESIVKEPSSLYITFC